MCNRYSSTKNEARLTLRLGSLQLALSPRFNVAPTNRAPVVIVVQGQIAASEMRWGVLGYNGKPVMNARSETARLKSMFRNAWAQRRCIIPADGFYEWKTEGRHKQPYRFVLHSEALFWFAGLWNEETKGPASVGAVAGSDQGFVILTKEANADVRPVHDRMPLILTADEIEPWLSGDTTREWVPSGVADGELRCYPVGPHVSTPGLETADCVAPLSGVPIQTELW